MALKRYGVLKGTVTGHLRDADDDHYQILVAAGKTMHRIAVNVKSAAKNAPSTLLFLARSKLSDEYMRHLDELAPGFSPLGSKSGGLALDYVRNGWFKPDAMTEVPPDKAGDDNDLKDKVESAVIRAVKLPGSWIHAFGQKWGPEKEKKDKYFKFLPGNGIHDIHMNQGNGGPYKKDNGVFQDGGLIFSYPDGKCLAFFFRFQSQTLPTDDSGNPLKSTSGTGGKPKKKVKDSA
jgi:uncharacterized protein YukJ